LALNDFYIIPDSFLFFIAWLNIIAAENKNSPNKLLGINDILQKFYSIYGRSFYSRYDYEGTSPEGGNALAAHLDNILKSGSLDKSVHTSASTSEKFTVAETYNFEYKDTITHAVSKGHGQVITFTDGSRVVFRLSTQGDAVRMYVERYVPADAGPEELAKPAAEGLKGLIEVALEFSKMKEFLGRDKPTVITVSLKLSSSICYVSCLTMTDFPFHPPKVTIANARINGEHRIYQKPGSQTWKLN
jgi:phosphoglucomutase